ncbi:MAG: carbamoyl-phosphate synthase large subunit [Phycisphaeraceae bacterium]|nr:carbamoyl-phosphate synthase large subunit [Phycisphaeraceae bacterium]
MPKRTDIKTILILGSGPIVIGQGCEFDYSGTQACKALRAEGYRVVLVNSNPATIMTDPEFSDRTFIEPITPEAVRKVIEAQKAVGDPVHAILPTLGGQTALNCACALFDNGTLEEFGVEMIGANRKVIHRAEDRQAFKEIVEGLGLKMPKATTVNTLEEGRAFLEEIGLPAIIRPAFTLGGSGGGIAYNTEEFDEIVQRGLRMSPITQVQIDQSVLGWKEYELEVVRDKKDNCIIVCGIENIDPMGVHTGDSITVAPILTLTDKEYQAMRDAAMAIMRAVGVETGGSNVQFAVNPNPKPGPDGRKPFEMVVVEMNPRVSRSSALASKATGFPIAKIAARLAVGYTLDELRNDITGTTSACFEPAIDYIVTKMPRWTFEKFPEADETLTTQMKSVGEGMAIGRTFCESLQKAIRSMEVKRFGLGLDRNDKWLAAVRAVESKQLQLDADGAVPSDTGLKTADGEALEWPIPEEKLSRKLAVPSQGRLYYIRYAMKMGWSDGRIFELSKIDPFFLDQFRRLVEFEDVLLGYKRLEDVPGEVLFRAKQLGYSDPQLANLYLGKISVETILAVRRHRQGVGIEPVYKLVDTCAAEFEAVTPYFYSTYEAGTGHQAPGIGSSPRTRSLAAADEIRITDKPKVIILGGGPNRIGQGIEFDYCCVHASFAARELGFESVMINSNPETVSTDYDTSDLLFFEPLTLEDVLNVVERLDGRSGKAAERQSGRVGVSSEPTGGLAPGDSAASSGLVHGLIIQFGGQTPLNLGHGLVAAGAPIIGTSVDSIDLAEDRDRFDAMLNKLGLSKPPSGIARSLDQAVEIAGRIGYPVLVRPSYVLGGRGMEICSDEKALRHYMTNAVDISDLDGAPVLIDRFLDDATEVDVDVVADFGGQERHEGTEARRHEGKDSAGTALVCGVMEHIEQAGIHSGDSACTIPPWSLRPGTVERIKGIARELARELRVRGLMNVQMAIKQSGEAGVEDEIYILEVNPRASRTVPFVGKAKHVPWARIAAKVMMGKSLAELGAREVPDTGAYAVKESVFPFGKFPGVDVVLGPEMRSTGEVMGIDASLPIAFAKSQMGASVHLPLTGNVFISVRESDRGRIVGVARLLSELGFGLFTTAGTGEHLRANGVESTVLQKIGAGARPNVIDLMADGKIQLVINTPTKTGWQTDEGRIRSATVRLGVPMITTATGGLAVAKAIAALSTGGWGVKAMQDFRARAMTIEPKGGGNGTGAGTGGAAVGAVTKAGAVPARGVR